MEKYYEEFDGKQYVCRVVDLSLILDNYTTENIGSCDYSDALQEAEENGYDCSGYDNEIYCYLDGDLLENASDSEILLAIISQEGEEQTKEQWFNLAQLADLEISGMYEKGEINMNAECYEMDDNYTCYAYNGDARCTLYDGKSAKIAAITMVNVVRTIRLMRMN